MCTYICHKDDDSPEDGTRDIVVSHKFLHELMGLLKVEERFSVVGAKLILFTASGRELHFVTKE